MAQDRPRSIAAILGSGKVENDSDFIVQVWRKMAFDNNNIPEEERAKLSVILMKDRDWGKWSDVTVFQHKGKFVRNFLNANYKDELDDPSRGSYEPVLEKTLPEEQTIIPNMEDGSLPENKKE